MQCVGLDLHEKIITMAAVSQKGKSGERGRFLSRLEVLRAVIIELRADISLTWEAAPGWCGPWPCRRSRRSAHFPPTLTRYAPSPLLLGRRELLAQ